MKNRLKLLRNLFSFLIPLTLLVSVNAISISFEEYDSPDDLAVIQKYLNSTDFQLHYSEDPDGATEMLESILESRHTIYGSLNAVAPYSYNPYLNTAWVETTLIRQKNDYYCGPASALMAIWGWGGTVTGATTDAMQDTLANQIGTNSSGSIVYYVCQTLNSYLTSRLYSYYEGSTLDEFLFRNYITNSLTFDRAPILHARTEYLPYYNGHSTGHYITIAEYNTNTYEVTLYDPHPNDAYYGIHTVSASQALSSLPSGRYLIASGSGN